MILSSLDHMNAIVAPIASVVMVVISVVVVLGANEPEGRL